MFRPQAQAETHRDPAGPPRASRRPCAETHRDPDGPPLASASGTYFFLFLNRLQAQARAVAQQQRTWMATHNFIDSP
jgi:hypothetical protein